MRGSVLAALAASLLLTGASLPDSPPVPMAKPGEPADAAAPQVAVPQTPAVPEPKPDRDPADGPPDSTPHPSKKRASGEVPEKPASPDKAKSPSDEKQDAKDGQNPEAPSREKPDDKPSEKPGDKANGDDAAKTEPKESAIVREDPAKLEACLSDLKALGAVFEPQEPISEEDGVCGIEKPIIVKQPLPGIRLSEPFPMRCEAALALSGWLKDTVQPTLKIAMPNERLTGVRNAASYVCRKRNHAETGKISEHARGNAIDIIGLEFEGKETMAMTPMTEDSTMRGAFQRTVTAGACLHFTTVLSPGSDATHQDHLHLDVLARDGGYRYCR